MYYNTVTPLKQTQHGIQITCIIQMNIEVNDFELMAVTVSRTESRGCYIIPHPTIWSNLWFVTTVKYRQKMDFFCPVSIYFIFLLSSHIGDDQIKHGTISISTVITMMGPCLLTAAFVCG